jgi:hypothetical protein
MEDNEMSKPRFLLAFALLFAVCSLSTNSIAYTFTPASPSDTNSGYLLDNYSVHINGVEVNSNSGFEKGDFTDFLALPGTQVITNLGNISPASAVGGQYFAFANTGPGATPGGQFMHENIMQPFHLEGGVTSAEVSFDLIVLTNQNPPTTSDPDWFHSLIWYQKDGNSVFGTNLFYSDTSWFTFGAADPSTGFKWKTDLIHKNFDITNFVNQLVTDGVSDFQVHAVIAEKITVPEPGTLALLGVGLAGLAASRRRMQ